MRRVVPEKTNPARLAVWAAQNRIWVEMIGPRLRCLIHSGLLDIAAAPE